MRALAIAATGMNAQQTNVEVIANNIANINTTGFKRARAEFTDLLYQTERVPGAPNRGGQDAIPEGAQIGLGVRTAAIRNLHMQGALTKPATSSIWRSTAAAGSRSRAPNGETLYTRAGAFNKNATGQIVTARRLRRAAGDDRSRRRDRRHRQRDGAGLRRASARQTTLQLIGQLTLANFANDAGLEPLGGNLYRETTASGTAGPGVPGDPGFGTVQQGYLENSNVDPVKEITELISAQRAYEMNSKVIQAADEMFGDRVARACASMRNAIAAAARWALLASRSLLAAWRCALAGAGGRGAGAGAAGAARSTIYPGDIDHRRAAGGARRSSRTPWRARRSSTTARGARRQGRAAHAAAGPADPVSAVREPYLVDAGQDRARRVRGRRADHLDQALALQTAASATWSACAIGQRRRSSGARSSPDGTIRVDGAMMRARCLPGACCLARACQAHAGDAHQGHRRPCRACAPTSWSATAWSSASTAPATAAQLAVHRAVAAIDARPHGHQRAQRQGAHAQRRRRDRHGRPAGLRRQGLAHRRHGLLARRCHVAGGRLAGPDAADRRRQPDLRGRAGPAGGRPALPAAARRRR